MIANTFIKRPVTAIVISIILIISGIICIFNLAVDQYPNISPPGVGISGQYTGADAQTVEQTVAIPVETSIGLPVEATFRMSGRSVFSNDAIL